MRVVSGSAGGRRLVAPPGHGTRPTSDRVREAIFNALWSLGAVEDARVIDLFAGSGAMGIEALSRGASHATFVERDRDALAAIRANLATTGLAEQAEVVPADVLAYLARTGLHDRRWDLALCDPPYRYTAWHELVPLLPADLAVIESDHPVTLPDEWSVLRDRRYGTTVVVIARRHSTSEEW